MPYFYFFCFVYLQILQTFSFRFLVIKYFLPVNRILHKISNKKKLIHYLQRPHRSILHRHLRQMIHSLLLPITTRMRISIISSTNTNIIIKTCLSTTIIFQRHPLRVWSVYGRTIESVDVCTWSIVRWKNWERWYQAWRRNVD